MASRSLSRDSRPSRLASSSSILISSGAATSLTLTSKVAALPARLGGAVVLRERDVDRLLLAGRDALELLGEAGDELGRAEADLRVLVGAALEGLAVDLADIGHGDAVAGRRLPVLRREGARRFGELAQLLVDLLVLDLGDRPLDRDRLEVLELDLRQDLVGHRVGEVGPAGEHLVGLLLVLGQLEVRLHGGALAALGDRVAGDLVDDVLDDLGHRRFAEQAAEMVDRHLAGPEALDADFVLQRRQPRHQPAVQLGGRNDHLELPLQSLGEGFGDLHVTLPVPSFFADPPRRSGRIGSPEGESSTGMVRAEGLEPPRLSSREPKSRASTSSATPAGPADGLPPRRRLYIIALAAIKGKMARFRANEEPTGEPAAIAISWADKL